MISISMPIIPRKPQTEFLSVVVTYCLPKLFVIKKNKLKKIIRCSVLTNGYFKTVDAFKNRRLFQDSSLPISRISPDFFKGMNQDKRVSERFEKDPKMEHKYITQKLQEPYKRLKSVTWQKCRFTKSNVI